MKFLRRDSNRYSKLGKNRKNKQKWRRPTGRDNKMREQRTGYPAVVAIGYKTDKKQRSKINGNKTVPVRSVSELSGIKKNETVILARMGKKKKLEVAKKVQESGIQIQNLNAKRFLKRNEKKKPTKSEKDEDKEKNK